MRKTKAGIVGKFLLAAAALLCAAPGRAYIVDGLLSDWGVVPFSQWAPASLTADWSGGVGENNWGGVNNTVSLNGFGGERFDAEAFYMDDDPLNVYFALVTSFPQAGVNMSGIHYRTGDIAIDLYPGGSSAYEYGVKTSGASFGRLALNPTWSLPHAAQGFPVNGPSEFSGGTTLGNVPLVYYNTFITDNGYTNYVIEGAISKELLGGPGHHDINLHWTMSCGNDAVNIKGDLDNPVPEPATAMLLGSGLVGLAGLWRRKRTLA